MQGHVHMLRRLWHRLFSTSRFRYAFANWHGIATPEYPWPMASATLDGLVTEGLQRGDRIKGYKKDGEYKPERHWGEHARTSMPDERRAAATPYARGHTTRGGGATSYADGYLGGDSSVIVEEEVLRERASSRAY